MMPAKLNRIILVILFVIYVQPGLSNTYNIKDFGATTDTSKVHTKAIQAAIDACARNGGVVIIPKGYFKSGSLQLKSNISLHLEPGAVLFGSNNAGDYPIHPPTFDSYTNNYQLSALLFAENAENIMINGSGTIDCNGGTGDFYMTKEEWKKAENERQRPFGILMRRCKNITLEGITLQNSAFWMQQYLECENLRLLHVNVYNHANYNNDGLDLNNCKDVIVKGCRIYCSDDAIAIKSTTPKINENIVISDCILRSHYNGFKIGTETNGGVKNVTLTNCVIGSPGYQNHHGSNNIGFCGIALQSNDGGLIENITISNVTIDSMMTPFFIRLQDRGRKISENFKRQPPGTMKNINISDVIATNMTKLTSSVTGIPGHYAENIQFSDIRIHVAGGGTAEDVNTPVPEKEGAYPDVVMFKTFLPAYGFYVRHVKNVHFSNISIHTETADDRHAFVFDDVQGANLSKVMFFNERGVSSSIKIINSQDIYVDK